MADEFCLKMPDFHVTFRDLLHAVNLRHGTNGFTSLPCSGFFFVLQKLTASAGFEPANLGTKGQHAKSRPPKPLMVPLQGASFPTVFRPRVSMCLSYLAYVLQVPHHHHHHIWANNSNDIRRRNVSCCLTRFKQPAT